ncbi:MAG: MurR/RpiR family transcriptional regulator [Erysipelotrichaceae bacterium]|nr:MurR/RpiR family transcriptional regulator [Erysipelotrichaceae bacterium]
MNYNLIINSYLPALTKSEKIVAEYVLNNSNKVMHSTLQEISKQTNVGEATVLRFCNRIGCDKFADLKLLIAQSSELNEKKISNTSSPIESTTANMISIIEDTKSLLDEESINTTITLIEKSKRLWLYGVGSSGLSALIGESNFRRIGVFSHAINEPHFQALNSTSLSKDDLVLAFSISGNTKDTYEACLIAKNNGAKIVAITNYIESEIAKIADCVLLTAAREHLLKGGTLTGTVSQLFVIDVLKVAYTNKHKEKVKQSMDKMARSIMNKSL